MAALPDVNGNFINTLQNNKSVQVSELIWQKESLELCNINAAIENQGIGCITTNNLLLLSRLINKTDSHTLKVWLKDKEVGEYDNFTDGTEIIVSSTTLSEQYIEYGLSGNVAEAADKTLVIATNTNKPIVIYNGITAETANRLAEGKFRVYFN